MPKKEITTSDIETLKVGIEAELNERRKQMGQLIHRIWFLKDELRRISEVESASKETTNA